MSLEGGILSRGLFGLTREGNFTSLCPNGSQWVWDIFMECAQDSRDMASVCLGLFSILCFMVSSLPQYHSSCKTGNMDSALSIWFLLLWLGGDTCNLVGSFLADQLPLQTYTAVYYVVADLVMLAMYFYYMARNNMTNRRMALHAVSALCIVSFTANVAALPGSGPETVPMLSGFKSRSLLANSEVRPFTTKEIIGFSIGSVSSVLYLCSRLPQMYTNYKRKSTEGVSYFLFALVILGNTTYGLSVLLKNPEDGQGEGNYILHHLPWLIGSLGTLSLDLLISIQFMMYRKSVEAGRAEETTALLA